MRDYDCGIEIPKKSWPVSVRPSDEMDEMDLALYNLIEDDADEELLLLSLYFREESDDIYNERKREGCFNNLIQKQWIKVQSLF